MHAPTQEVVIGTSDSDNDATSNNGESTWEEHRSVLPVLAEVEMYVALLRSLVANGGAPIEVTSFELIESIVDKLDQVYYWALEEGTTFLKEPSLLAQCEVPQLTVSCVMTRRPRIVVAALRIMRYLLRHEQSGPQLLAVARRAMEEGFLTSNARTDNDNDEGSGLFGMLAFVMRQHPGLSDLQAEAAAVAGEAALLDIKGLLESAVISRVLEALERHGDSTAVQKEGISLFSTLVDIEQQAPPCMMGVANDESTAAPVAILLSQIGVVVRFVVGVMKANNNNVEVKRNGVHFFLRCASYPENIHILLQDGAYPVLAAALPTSVRVPELFVELTEAIAHFIPVLDPHQRRSLVLVLRCVLLETGSSFFVLLCATLLVRMLRLEPRSDEPLFPGMMQTPLPEEQEEETTASSSSRVRGGKLSCSDTISLGRDDIRGFMKACLIPQLLCCAADTLGEEDKVLRRVVGEAVRLLSPCQWR